jgi:hypothetical protein
MAEETNNQEVKPTAEKKADAKAKKEKAPKLEDKPFNEFISEHYLPTLKDFHTARSSHSRRKLK